MRNDLSRACAPCALRLPASERACPRCGAPLVDPETALRGLRASAPKQAIRDLVAFAPPSLGALVALVAGVVVAATSVRDTQVGGEAFRWAVTPAINLVAFTGVALCFAAVLSLPWIGIVHGVAWLGRSRIATISRGVEGRLRVEAFPRGGSRRRSHVGDAVASLRALLVRRWRSAVLLGYVLLLALELALELATPKPFFVGRSIGDVLARTAVLVVGQALLLVFAAIPLSLGLRWWLWCLRRGLHALRATREATEPARGPEAALRQLGMHRSARASGMVRASRGEHAVAPLSGRPCVAFRLVGWVGEALVDDSDGCEMHLEGEGGRVRIRAQTLAVVLPAPEQSCRVLEAEAARRVTHFLRARGLPFDSELELGETLLCDGDTAVAHGSGSYEPAAENAYRTSSQELVLSDSDGLPILVVAPTSAAVAS